jgi:hypothetical protein
MMKFKNLFRSRNYKGGIQKFNVITKKIPYGSDLPIVFILVLIICLFLYPPIEGLILSGISLVVLGTLYILSKKYYEIKI